MFARLRDTGAIAAADPAWCRQVFLALLHEVNDLPVDSPSLPFSANGGETGARVDLLVRTTLGALGGSHAGTALPLDGERASDG
ncbi:hypothetical protein [Streptomyces sp. NPDC046860]|uniref:hypothetical protein n=1 Tax=Streptomyces sp. NPDC046860 TaxID=3154495 RepID=UPI0033C60C9C